MEDLKTIFETNQKLWNTKTPIHVKSDFYNMDGFMKGDTSLRKIELELLPDLSNMDVLHPQCHFGQDTLSMERQGANCTGVDFSSVAVQKANEIRDTLNLKSEFVCCNVLEMDQYIDKQFDIVYCSYGIITWFPDLEIWANQIAKRLKPGGSFYFVEFHPVFYMFDWETDQMAFDYFNSGKPEIEIEKGTYADNGAEIEMKEYYWMHSLSEIFNALAKAGLSVDDFQEYDYSPYKIFKNCKTRAEQEYVYQPTKGKIPHVFSMVASKK
jgi:ubiquinone/menaquinone biosynthesis C-methylase UbiE